MAEGMADGVVQRVDTPEEFISVLEAAVVGDKAIQVHDVVLEPGKEGLLGKLLSLLQRQTVTGINRRLQDLLVLVLLLF